MNALTSLAPFDRAAFAAIDNDAEIREVLAEDRTARLELSFQLEDEEFESAPLPFTGYCDRDDY